jgi:hypothetical protein
MKKENSESSARSRKTDLSVPEECGFYRLQKRLRDDGWYVEWTDEGQLMHAWEDMPGMHSEGPFKGMPIDDTKCLLSCVGDPSDLLEAPEDLEEDEYEQWFEGANEKLETGDIVGLAELVDKEVVDKILDCSPGVWGGNTFIFGPDGEENLREVLPLFEACGCRHGEVSHGTIWIEWDRIDESNGLKLDGEK